MSYSFILINLQFRAKINLIFIKIIDIQLVEIQYKTMDHFLKQKKKSYSSFNLNQISSHFG